MLLYIFFIEGRNALYGDERFYNLFNFKIASYTNFLHLGSIPSVALTTTTK